MNTILKNLLPYGLVKKHQKNKEDLLMSGANVSEPELYNLFGEKMRVFYLQDRSSRFAYTFTAGQSPRYILWDRDNYLLPIHFYTHNEIFNTKNTAEKKFGLLMEPEVMIPNTYKRLYSSADVVKEFDAIFTHSERLLNQYSNAKLYLGQGVWYGTSIGGGIVDSNAYQKKDKDVSIVSSNKQLLESHKLRIQIAKAMKLNPKVDTFGAFDGGVPIKVADALTCYRFSIILENEISAYYFTEKILNCFASMTIPIYAGAEKIGEFFNRDGIVVINKYAPIEEINDIVNKCSKELYEERIPAIIDNFNRVQEYLNVDDFIFLKYKDMFNIL